VNNTPINTHSNFCRWLFSFALLLLSLQSIAQQQNSTDGPQSTSVTESATKHTIPKMYVVAKIDHSEAYVNEQILLSVNVMVPTTAFNVRQEKLTTDKADVFVLYKDVTETVRDNLPYQLIKTNYAIFFKAPGDHSIPSLRITATLPVSAGGANAKSNPKIGANSMQIDIKVKPAPVAAREWLPARNVTAESSWQLEGDGSAFIAGQPVARVYEITVSGQYPTAIPSLNYKMPDGIRVYSNPPVSERKNDKSGAAGTLTQLVNLIPGSAGSYHLPALDLKWWDIETLQWKNTTIPGETIEIQPSPVKEKADVNSHYRLLALLLAATTGILSILCVHLFYRLRSRPTDTPALSVHSEKKPWALVTKALNNGESQKARRHIVEWHSIINESTAKSRLEEIGTHDDELNDLLRQLDASVYSQSGCEKVNHKALKVKLSILRKTLKRSSRKLDRKKHSRSKQALTDLYPLRR